MTIKSYSITNKNKISLTQNKEKLRKEISVNLIFLRYISLCVTKISEVKIIRLINVCGIKVINLEDIFKRAIKRQIIMIYIPQLFQSY